VALDAGEGLSLARVDVVLAAGRAVDLVHHLEAALLEDLLQRLRHLGRGVRDLDLRLGGRHLVEAAGPHGVVVAAPATGAEREPVGVQESSFHGAPYSSSRRLQPPAARNPLESHGPFLAGFLLPGRAPCGSLFSLPSPCPLALPAPPAPMSPCRRRRSTR